jgi:hypothetical protein
MDYRRFVETVGDYQVLPRTTSRVVGFAIPWLELGIGSALVMGLVVPVAGGLSLLLLAAFTTAVAVNIRHGRRISCNCYGIASTSTIGWGTLGRNGLLLIMAGLVVWLPTQLGVPTLSARRLTSDWSVLSSPTVAALILLVVASGVALVSLIEWGFDSYAHATSVRSAESSSQTAVKAHARGGGWTS